MNVETVRCARCGVFTPSEDIVLGRDGRPYCDRCPGPPAAARVRPDASEDWADPAMFRTSGRDRLGRAARIVATLMVLVTLAFPLAACLSQL